MDISNVQNFEFEVSSLCNARCPLCSRTQILDNINIPDFDQTYLSLIDLRKVFDHIDLSGKGLTFNGNVGDPMTNPEFIDIITYFHEKAEKLNIEIRTNGGLRDQAFWQSMGTISKSVASKKGSCKVVFAIDGLEDTNHIYRVGVNYNKVIENLKTYINAGGDAAWAFIVFDHNYKQEDEIRQFAKSIGVRSFIKVKSLRNVVKDIPSMNQSSSYTFSPDIIERKKEIIQIIRTPHVRSPVNYTEQMTCLHKHGNRVFIMGGMTVWPCCTFYDMWQRKKPKFMDSLKKYGPDFNSLHKHTLAEILNSPFFEDLPKRWDERNELFTGGCIMQCSHHGQFDTVRNEENIHE